jgi:hypothetical protein
MQERKKKTRILCRYEKRVLRLQVKITADVARVTGAGQNYWQIM